MRLAFLLGKWGDEKIRVAGAGGGKVLYAFLGSTCTKIRRLQRRIVWPLCNMKHSIFFKRKGKGPFELSNEKMVEFENADGRHRNNGISGRGRDK